MKATLNRVATATLFAAMATCFILQTYNQVVKYYEREVHKSTEHKIYIKIMSFPQVTQSVASFLPSQIELPTIIICRQNGINISVLETNDLPESMFWDVQSYFTVNLPDSTPFPADLNDTWSKATTNVLVTAKVDFGSGSMDNNLNRSNTISSNSHL